MQLPTRESLKKINLKYVLAGLVLLILLIGGGVGFYLASKPQELRQQAAGGYLDCAGGVKDGAKACSGFREVVICRNGAFVPSATCAADEKCDTSVSSGCSKTALSCAGGVPNGGTSCDTLRSYVTCNNGTFSVPTQCPAGVTCSNGSCGGGQAGYCDRSGPNTTQCTDKNVGAACRSTSNVSGTCQQTIPGGANSECSCVPGTPASSPTASPVSACQPSQAACDDGANKCCAGFVCQGSNNSRICQPQTANQCGTGFTCGGSNGWLGFQCDSTNQGASGSECLSNMRVFSDYNSAYAYASANGCGQVDEVCSGGPQQNKLCGSFQIISSGCGGTGGPVPTPTAPGASPQPSVVPGVTPTPVVSPTPGVTPTPVVSPTPGVTPTPAVSPSPTPAPVCGQSCSTTSQCPQDHTCNNGTCQLTACVNGAACDTSRCRVTACGSTCTTTADCPNDHSCSSSVCKLNACLNGSSCSSDACRVTACGSTCSSNADCPNDHTCNGGVCKLNACLNGSTCNSNQCSVLTPSPVPSPVLGCNDVCVNNSDCKSSSQICVDTSSGRRCRLETNITSDTCSAPGQTAAVSTPQPAQPAALPVAGSSDILKALGVGVLAIVLGVIGFLAL